MHFNIALMSSSYSTVLQEKQINSKLSIYSRKYVLYSILNRYIQKSKINNSNNNNNHDNNKNDNINNQIIKIMIIIRHVELV